jgi:bacterioferritin-associated ferredoxin
VAVNRCICFETSFAEIRRIACEQGSLAEAHRQTGFGARCGLCVPYVLLMMRTGSEDLPVLWSADFADHGIPAPSIVRLERLLAQARACS